MKTFFYKFKNYLKEFTPKTFVCLSEGYSWKFFMGDLSAGISVGIIALPLALAFAIASGVAPERGLFTAIIAGFLISFLGGSRVQIGGPTGAYVVLIYGIVQKFGYEGLAAATFLAAIMLILMGYARLGVLLKFIPYPVTVGFTAGIAFVIFSSQVKDFFGLNIAKLPPDFIGKWKLYFYHFNPVNFSAIAIASFTLIFVFFLRKRFPKLPGAMIAIALGTLLAYFLKLPVETIESKFGTIPRVLPGPKLPLFSLELFKSVFPSSITIALLGAIESLLSAVVADGVTGHRHRSNCELVAQGFANLGSVMFGGIPATGAIARTSANIKLGAKTPISGMIHALTILVLMLFLAPLVIKIPLAALSAVMIFIAWNMSELPHFIEILKGQKGDAAVLVTTFFLTVLFDLTVAVQVGVLFAALIFMKRMTDRTSIAVFSQVVKESAKETSEKDDDKELFFQKDLPKEIAIFEIKGPFFYSVSHLLDEALRNVNPSPQVFILGLDQTPLIDATGIRALRQFAQKCRQKKILFLVGGVREGNAFHFKKPETIEILGKENLFPSLNGAIFYAQKYLQKLSPLPSNPSKNIA